MKLLRSFGRTKRFGIGHRGRNTVWPGMPAMARPAWSPIVAAALLVTAASFSATASLGQPALELLNVSYDPTRELWRELNEAFRKQYEAKTGQKLVLRQSHGGSASQARAVIDGLEADVVTLALWSDVDAIRSAGWIRNGWEERLPNHSVPYHSTIVFVVRKGNLKGIRDWPDLIRSGVQVVSPNPKTSGNGRLSFLAAWGAVVLRGGSEQDAQSYVAQLYRNVPVLDIGARGSTVTFVQRKIGDVHLTWENEAHLEVAEANGTVEIVYPPISVLAEPPVAWVDRVVERKGTRAVAEAYLEFLFTEPGQEIIAKHFYRPVHEAVLHRYGDRFPALRLLRVQEIAPNWVALQEKFFAEGALFDRIVAPAKEGKQP